MCTVVLSSEETENAVLFFLSDGHFGVVVIF
jgi:hypothetical protein